MKVVVSVVNFNTKDLTIQCIKSVLNQKSEFEIDLWVVDNASNDGSLQSLKKISGIKLIENKINVGFAKAHNQVLKVAKGDFYLVLNSDTVLDQGVINKMVNFMKNYPDCGIASCKVLGFDGKLQPNGGDLPFGPSLLVWLFNLESIGLKSPSFHRADKDYYENTHQAGWVSGNFMFIRADVLKEIGYFSEDYFMYFEDVEYCFRVKKHGYIILINPNISIKHLSGGSLDDPKFRQWSGEFSGLIFFYRKQFGQIPAFLIRLLVYAAAILRALIFAIIGKLDYAKTYAKVVASI